MAISSAGTALRLPGRRFREHDTIHTWKSGIDAGQALAESKPAPSAAQLTGRVGRAVQPRAAAAAAQPATTAHGGAP
ncbi:hypothetical protein, partial [Tahibacter caeni]|uniref:hypothetical protein n=1 Tax=Tahibacter caeni TaxID=1453545 RepID=UPI0021479D6F